MELKIVEDLRGHAIEMWAWPRAKSIFRVLVLVENMLVLMGKSMPYVKIDPWPNSGHFFMLITFSKISKIAMKMHKFNRF